MRTILRAIKLELRLLAESKFGLMLIILLPALITVAFSFVGKASFPIEPEKSFYDFYSPIFLVILFLFFGIQQSMLRIVGERSPYGTLERDLMAIKAEAMILGKYIANGILMFLQCAVLFTVIYFIAPIRGFEGFLDGFIVVYGIGLAGVSIGFLISVFSNTKELAMQLMPYLILSFFLAQLVVIFPETASGFTESIVKIIPSSNGTKLLMKIFDNEKLVNENLAIVAAWIFVPLIISIIKFSISEASQ